MDGGRVGSHDKTIMEPLVTGDLVSALFRDSLRIVFPLQLSRYQARCVSRGVSYNELKESLDYCPTSEKSIYRIPGPPDQHFLVPVVNISEMEIIFHLIL